ncbi:hypothetical protein RSUY_32620 (plasmid) [Ralstonia solanacearum]|nr:hypothetical protein RSUY_32620 [Ralstonia solanacearum]
MIPIPICQVRSNRTIKVDARKSNGLQAPVEDATAPTQEPMFNGKRRRSDFRMLMETKI